MVFGGAEKRWGLGNFKFPSGVWGRAPREPPADETSWPLPEGQSCRKDRKAAAPQRGVRPAGLDAKGQATQPARPPTKAGR